MEEEILLVGAGRMSMEYSKVLRAMNIPFIVVGRSEKSAENFKQITGISPFTGGIERFIEKAGKIPDIAIIAVNVVDLYKVCKLLIRKGVSRILLEKPGALFIEEINDLFSESVKSGSSIFIAYNRRFYNSVEMAKEILASDGGVLSFNFEFTEWSDKVEAFVTDTDEKNRWFISNSSHVADLAFYLGGKPVDIKCYTAGGLPWHESASIFGGSGITDKGAIFSYTANWNAPGRWGVELLSAHNRVILRPLEQLQILKKGSLQPESYNLEDDLDKKFKPGLYRLVEAFLKGDYNRLCSVKEQAEMFRYYCLIANYD